MSSGQAEADRYNFEAEIRRQEAERERQLGELNAKRQREDNERLAATQRARLAGSGRDVGTGSALLLQDDLAEEGEFNALLLEADADAKVRSKLAERELSLAAGRNASTASFFRAGSALLK